MIPLLAEAYTLEDVAKNPWPWLCIVLVSANAAQYARDWLRERRHNAEIDKRDAALSEAQARHRTDLIAMIPPLTRVLDFLKK